MALPRPHVWRWLRSTMSRSGTPPTSLDTLTARFQQRLVTLLVQALAGILGLSTLWGLIELVMMPTAFQPHFALITALSTLGLGGLAWWLRRGQGAHVVGVVLIALGAWSLLDPSGSLVGAAPYRMMEFVLVMLLAVVVLRLGPLLVVVIVLLTGDLVQQWLGGLSIAVAVGLTLGTLGPLVAAAIGLRLVLAETLQHFLDALNAQQQALVQAHATVEGQVETRTAELAAANAALATVNGQLVAAAAETTALAVAEERLRLAQDLHDHLGHHLVTLQLQLAQSRLSLPPQATTSAVALLDAEVLLAAAYQEVRATVQAIRPTATVNLPVALEQLAAGARRAGLDTSAVLGRCQRCRRRSRRRC